MEEYNLILMFFGDFLQPKIISYNLNENSYGFDLEGIMEVSLHPSCGSVFRLCSKDLKASALKINFTSFSTFCSCRTVCFIVALVCYICLFLSCVCWLEGPTLPPFQRLADGYTCLFVYMKD